MSPIKRAAAALLSSVAFTAAAPIVSATLSPAMAQETVQVTAEFRTALEPYGEFRHHRRWGEVWVPTRVARNWEPYTVGHWVDSEDYGWYWVSDEAEADWGWVTFHYGRWVLDRDMGWVWIPGRTWGPGFVSWRRGGHRGAEYVAWAPEPPDELIVDVRDEPDYWICVRARDFTAPRIVDVILPPRERITVIRDTVVVNRTVLLDDRGFAVNPGIAPAFVAAAVGRPITTYRVRPVVLAGTANIAGATVVRANELRQQRQNIVRQASTVQATNNVIRPSANVPPPQALPANARQGRLDVNPPRAARGTTTGAGAPQQGMAPRNERSGAGPQQGAVPPPQRPGAQRPGQPPTTSGQGPTEHLNRGAEQRRPGERGAVPNAPGLAPNAQRPGQPPATSGQGPAEHPNRGAEQRRPGERGAMPNAPGHAPNGQAPNQPRGTTGAAPSSRDLNRGGDHRPPGAQQLPERAPHERGTTGAAPSGPHEPNLGNARRPSPGLENRAVPHDRPSLDRGAGPHPGTTGAAPLAPRGPNLNERHGGPPAMENRAAPHAPAARPGGPPPPAAQAPPHSAPAAQAPHAGPPSTTGAGPRGGGGPHGGGPREEHR